MPGRNRFGNCIVLKKLGEGNFAKVYLGEHTLLKIQVAIKVLTEGRGNNEGFLYEARTLAKLKHPHIVRILDFGVEETLFLIMEFAPNGTLQERHPIGERVPLSTIITYVTQIADALQYIHDKKLVHRDIKPQNMLLGPKDEIWLSDFGIAVFAHGTDSWEEQKPAGTKPYMAPEQFEGKAQPASDQYALGISVYQWLCGVRPFNGNELELMYQHLSKPPRPFERSLQIPPVVEAVVMKALAKQPNQRFPNVKDFADALKLAYVEANTTSDGMPEFTVELLSQENNQQILLDLIIAKPEWWEQEGRAKIVNFCSKEEVERTKALSTLAQKAVDKMYVAIERNEYITFRNMLDVIYLAVPPYDNPTLWINLLKQLNGAKIHTFLAKNSKYRGKTGLLDLLLQYEVSERQRQQFIEWLLKSDYLTVKERGDFLETYGEKYIPRLPKSSILLDRVREYLQTLNVDNLGKDSRTTTFLQFLSNFSLQLPLDIQTTVKNWRVVSDFIAQPTIERTRFNILANVIASLSPDAVSKLIKKLAKALTLCIKNESDLIGIVDRMNPVLKSDMQSLLYSMAEIVAEEYKQQRVEASFVPYIRLALEVERIGNIVPTDQDRFELLDTLLQKADFEELRRCITEQNWPLKLFTQWKDYLLYRFPAPARLKPPGPISPLPSAPPSPSGPVTVSVSAPARPMPPGPISPLPSAPPRPRWQFSYKAVLYITLSLLIIGSISLIYFGITSLGQSPGSNSAGATAAARAATATAAARAYDMFVSANGVMFSFDSSHTRFNLYEEVLNSSNVSELVQGWTAPTGDRIHTSPVVANGVVYVGSFDGKLYALKAFGCGHTSCSPLWIASTGGAIESSPAVANGVVYIGSDDHKLYAFQAAGCGQASCSPLWTATTGGALVSSPTVAHGIVYVGSNDHKLYAFQAAGCGRAFCSPLWTAATRYYISSSPAVVNGIVYVGSEDRKLYAFQATGCGRASCSPLWTAATGGALVSSPAVVNGVVYIGSFDGKLYAFQAAGCGRASCSPLWTAATGGIITSSPAVVNGIVYIGSDDFKLYAFQAGGCGHTSCLPLWIALTGGAIESSPAVANGVVYIGSDDHKLYAFQAGGCSHASCSPLWSAMTGNYVISSPAVAYGMVYVGSHDGKLYAFNLSGTLP